MAYASVILPFDDYLHDGLTATRALELLEEHDALTFPQLKSGLFPGVNFDDLENDETGMADAWLRDSACIGMALLSVGREREAKKAAKAIIKSLKAISERFEEIVNLGHAPADDTLRPPVRFTGQQSSPQFEWANAQNDAIGYCLLFLGKAAQADIIAIDDSLRRIVDLIINYLGAISYWEDDDSGHWEEVKKVSASSIGTVIAGLRAIRTITDNPIKVEALISRGDEALRRILPFESRSGVHEREFDAAQVFLVEPQQTVSGEMAAQIIKGAEKALLGEFGIRRYNGDSYWGPDYREHFQLGSRAIDFSNPKVMALRDTYLTSDSEAQWTLFDPMIALYYIHQYETTRHPDDAAKAIKFTVRSLMSVVVHAKSDDTIVWRIPESFFKEEDEWVPNDHLGLLWSQAHLLLCLTEFKRVLGDTPIRMTPKAYTT